MSLMVICFVLLFTSINMSDILHLLIFVLSARIILSVYIVSEICTENLCFVLHRTNKTHPDDFTWYDGKSLCTNRNTNLAAIPDQSTQAHIVQWLNTLSLTGSVWVSGQRSSDGTWKRLDGTRYDTSVTGVGDCLFASIDDTNIIDVKSGDCKEAKTFICQTEGDCTDPSSYQIGGMCVTASGEGPQSWYKAQTKCHANNHGSLIYDPELLRNTTNIVNILTHNNDFWLGVSRYPWKWTSGLPQHAPHSSETFTYYQFDQSSWISGQYAEHCIKLESGIWDWSNVPCTDRIPNVLCNRHSESTATPFTFVHKTTPSKPESPADTDNTSPTTRPTTMGSLKTTAESLSGQQPLSMTIIIVIAVVSAILVTVVIVVVVIVVLKKRRVSKSEPNPFDDYPHHHGDQNAGIYENENTSLQTHATISPYAEFEMSDTVPNNVDVHENNNGHGVCESVVYAEVKKPKKKSEVESSHEEGPLEIQHERGPLGDVYAIATKKGNKSSN